MSEMCCTRLAANTGRKNRRKIAIWAPSHDFVRLYLRNQGMHRQLQKNMLNSNISFTCPHNMANFSRLTAEIDSVVWGTAANFNGYRVLPSLLQRRRSPEANQTLHDVWRCLCWYTTYTFSGALAPLTEFCPVQNSLYVKTPSLVFSYTGSVTARHSSSRRQPNFAAWYKE